ncbi:hypothetical protein Aph01nite_18290 [Acrocarpospora phusangensis]|uniref:Uncharacterized protein n=1 Tax=Acrocarpospora phusangensis TaxID=1070424 RepID=A0A919Q6V7_9ACTN|nr:hypothetical protein Aph01nite_18290 [Acrocarpospora phusangensis]
MPGAVHTVAGVAADAGAAVASAATVPKTIVNIEYLRNMGECSAIRRNRRYPGHVTARRTSKKRATGCAAMPWFIAQIGAHILAK